MSASKTIIKLVLPIGFIRRFYRGQLRARLRGYRHYRRAGNQSLIYDINGALRACKVVIPNERFSEAIFGAAFENAELVVRQRLSRREGSVTKALLLAAGRKESRVTLPLPSEWLQVVESFGFVTSRYKSFLLLCLLALRDLFFGSLQVIVNLKNNFSFSKRSTLPLEKFVYFCDMVDTNLPQPVGNKNSYCVINWYLQWQGKHKDLHVIAHSVAGYLGSNIGDTRLVYRRSPLPDLVGVLSFMRYVFWAIKAISISAYDLIRGRWWHAMLLREASFAALVRYGDAETSARQYFFHNSRFYPPLWTYELQTLGSEAIFYWYSTNIEPWQRADGSRPFTTPYSLLNWPRHLVWDEVQADFVRECEGKNPSIDVVGPIWFQDNGRDLKRARNLLIAVFDVQPHRASLFYLYGPWIEYFIPAVVNSFLLDIVIESTKLNAVLLHKKKREIGKLAHPAYTQCTKLLSERSNYIEVNATASAFHTIQQAHIVISMPFTSTALSARFLGKPSIYYDPSFIIQSNDPAAHGIPIVQGPQALGQWLASYIRCM